MALRKASGSLKTLSMHDERSQFVVFLPGDPHLLERAETSEDRAADPDRILPLGRRDHFDLHGGWCERRYLLLHPIGDARIHCGATREHRIGVQIFADVNVAFHDRVVRRFMYAAGLHAQEARLEHRFRATEAFVTDRDDLKSNHYSLHVFVH